MGRPGKTWWGERFIAALAGFTDQGRLERGRAYSGDSRILAFAIADGTVTATVRGNINPYFGVYKEPRYQTRIRMAQISAKDWDQAIARIGNSAALVARLLMNEMPERIDEVFAKLDLYLLPRTRKDFAVTECSCPDGANPCKHIAGVYYRLAGELDSDPLRLFELRGLSRERLNRGLKATPLGKALASLTDEPKAEPVARDSYFTRPVAGMQTAASDYRAFWSGQRRLPTDIEPATPAAVPAILVRKAGDSPQFWDRDSSFVETMEEIYRRVREKNKEAL